ncbi:MAG: hypothetical protein KAT57_10565 [Candidatus Lokiarchaeota archaeon]|nr:hypothetical protein [Candidatus Lokiarchaeota archaeon]
MEQIPKIEEKVEQLSEVQRAEMYEYARRVSRETIEEVCPALLRLALDSEKGKLKNQLGMVIFHLQKNERLSTVIGLQKLLDAALIVNPEEMFKILESADEGAQELAKKIKSIL